jgi:hypothetical protein
MLSSTALFPKSLEICEDYRRKLVKLAKLDSPPPKWPVKTGGAKPQVYTVTRDKDGTISKVTQTAPFPKTNDGDYPGRTFECVATQSCVLGLGVQVEAGCLLVLMPSVAQQLREQGRIKIVSETRP